MMAAVSAGAGAQQDFQAYPAIDIRDGRVVRLAQGDYARETRYGDDPLAVIRGYAEQGARWLHLVDLDAARAGGYTLAPLLRDIATTTGLRVQTGGGVRSREDVARLLDAGAARVVIGSLAVREPEAVPDLSELREPRRNRTDGCDPRCRRPLAARSRWCAALSWHGENLVGRRAATPHGNGRALRAAA